LIRLITTKRLWQYIDAGRDRPYVGKYIKIYT
jgi:hypothetical protein